MTGGSKGLKLGKGVAFVKSHLRRLRQCEEVWETDIFPTSAPDHAGTTWVGLVISHDGWMLSERMFEKSPTVNDMARLVADAMLHSLDGNPRRPRTLRIRKRQEWSPLLPHLEQLKIRVVSAARLARWDKVFKDFVRKVLRSHPITNLPKIEELYPVLAQFVRTQGHIEIGDQEGFGFVARALDYGGLVFEDQKATTLAEAMSALEVGLTNHREQESFEDE